MLATESILSHHRFAEQVYLFKINPAKRVEHQETNIAASLRSGDTAVYESVFKTYYKQLCAYAIAILKDSDHSEEIVQQVFFKIWERRASLDISTSIKAYLYQSVRNDCLNVLKHEKIKERYRQYKVVDMQHQHESASHRVASRELEEQIQHAVDELPEQCGIIFRMSRFEELKYKEIAEQLDISVKTVENQMGKALKLLRVRLADYLNVILALIFFHP